MPPFSMYFWCLLPSDLVLVSSLFASTWGILHQIADARSHPTITSLLTEQGQLSELSNFNVWSPWTDLSNYTIPL